MNEKKHVRDLLITSSPHVAPLESIPRIMHTVWISLIPACLVSGYIFGYVAFIVICYSVIACIGFEALFLKIRGHTWNHVRTTAFDGSAIITGVLLALNLPVSSPWWLVIVGAFVAMSLGKHLFGGLGNNPFNPALTARVFLLISFPTHMLFFTPEVEDFTSSYDCPPIEEETYSTPKTDAETYATPLGKLKQAVRNKENPEKLAQIRAEIERDYPFDDLFLGFRSGKARGKMGGSLGEVSGLALLIGACFLLYRRYITWHIPVAFVASTALITGIAWAYNPALYVNPMYHVLSGGLLLGALYMATDMVTSPCTYKGMLFFGIGCGIITAVIRLWGSYPEGVSFAILIMNGLVPLIDKYTKPKKFGQTRRT